MTVGRETKTMALKCCVCNEILTEKDELAVLDYAETFFESEGRTYRHMHVSSGYCPECFDGLVNEAAMTQAEQTAA